jgi:hypothetical protein
MTVASDVLHLKQARGYPEAEISSAMVFLPFVLPIVDGDYPFCAEGRAPKDLLKYRGFSGTF